MGYSSGRYNSSLNTPPTPSANASLIPSFSGSMQVKETHPRMEMTQARILIRRNDGDSLHWERQRFRVGSQTLDARSPVCVYTIGGGRIAE
jgi:hypothetical protein